jgi:hypothetical protein
MTNLSLPSRMVDRVLNRPLLWGQAYVGDWIYLGLSSARPIDQFLSLRLLIGMPAFCFDHGNLLWCARNAGVMMPLFALSPISFYLR